MKSYSKIFKNLIKSCVKCLVAACISLIVGYLLLCLVYLIPAQGSIKDHVKESVNFLSIETGKIFERGTYYDKLSDCTFTMIAAYPYNSNPFIDSILCNRLDTMYPDYSWSAIRNYANDDISELQEYSYPQYWHGYLLLLKPLLFFMHIGQIRECLFVFNLVCLITIVLMLNKRKKIMIIPFVLLFLINDPINTSVCLMQFLAQAVMFVSIIIMLMLSDRHKADDQIWLIYFTIVGCVTYYFDMLTYPVVTLFIPLCLYVVLFRGEIKKPIVTVIKFSIFWSAGWLFMLAIKMLLGYIILGSDLNNSLYRINWWFNRECQYLSVVLKNIYYFFMFNINKILVVIVSVVGIFSLIKTKKYYFKFLITFLLISIVPLIVYFVLIGHSEMHMFFTYRELSISFFAATCYIGMLLENIHKTKSISNK